MRDRTQFKTQSLTFLAWDALQVENSAALRQANLRTLLARIGQHADSTALTRSLVTRGAGWQVRARHPLHGRPERGSYCFGKCVLRPCLVCTAKEKRQHASCDPEGQEEGHGHSQGKAGGPEFIRQEHNVSKRDGHHVLME